MLAGATGAALALFGFGRRDTIGTAAGVAGLGLLARGATNLEFKRPLGLSRDRLAIDVRKIININAPVDEVFQFWSNLENLPLFMEHVCEVRNIGEGRTHWVISGPAGLPLEWNAVITHLVPNQLLAWRSDPDSLVQTAGVVKLQPLDGATRLAIRLQYNPPGGAIGMPLQRCSAPIPRRLSTAICCGSNR